MKKIIFFCLLCPLFLQAQKPYWQQEVNYRIEVYLNDKKHTLSADEEMEYINHSPDVLNEIFIHLWPNAFKNKKTAFAKQQMENGGTRFFHAKDEELGYIDSLDFKVNGSKAILQYDADNCDIAKLILSTPLMPGEKIKISTPFHVKIPASFSRLGHIETSYQLTQWYPKPAVYDATGWHPIPYLDQGEFYSEFGSYDVTIHLPENYVVGATGDLQTASEIAFLDSLAAATQKIESFSSEDSFPESSKKMKTICFKQDKVHDFAWFADKRFHVMKSQVELPVSHRMVTTWVMFNNKTANVWKNGTDYVNDAIYYYSLWNGEYPYNQATAVDGALSAGGGMEYPTITIIGPVSGAKNLQEVIVHEVGHNWFYGILGSNERDHAWMDEGINSYNEKRYMRQQYPLSMNNVLGDKISFGKLNDYGTYNGTSILYFLKKAQNSDQPIDIPSTTFSAINYGASVYGKTPLLFLYLEQYLGRSVFDSCMHAYFERWKFKHPQPKDIQQCFEEKSGKKLDWFFEGNLKSKTNMDFKVKDLKKKDSEIQLTYRIRSDMKEPLIIYTFDKEGKLLEKTITEPASSGVYTATLSAKDAHKIVLNDPRNVPEKNQRNNAIYVHGLFKKIKPISVGFLTSIDNPERTQFFLIPALGYDYTDKWMPGLVFSNYTIPFKKLEFIALPMYSLALQKIVGTGRLAWHIPVQSGCRMITPAFIYSRFSDATTSFNTTEFLKKNPSETFVSNYQKLDFRIQFDIKPATDRSLKEKKIILRHLRILQDLQGSLNSVAYSQNNMTEIKFQQKNKNVLLPSSREFTAQLNEDVGKLFGEQKISIHYPSKNKGVDLRFFGGLFFYNDLKNTRYSYSLGRIKDYMYDEIVLAREVSGTFLDHQIATNDGGFKQTTSSFDASSWMLASNVKIHFPGKLPIGVYADIGISNANDFVTGNKNLYYDYGGFLNIIKDVVEIYFPFGNSSSKNLNQLKYSDQIKFIFKLQKLNPFDYLNNNNL